MKMGLQIRKWRWLAPCLLLSAALLPFCFPFHPREPLLEGRPLSDWFHTVDADYIWIPNDVYGHIHDELWEQLIASPGRHHAGTTWKWDAASRPVPNLPSTPGTNALPWLVRWMETRRGIWDRLAGPVAQRLPASWVRRFYPYGDHLWGDRHSRWHIAAFTGLSLMGTNAEPALPALARLLARDDADLPLTWAIANIGPRGVALLTGELAATNALRRDNAAMALGLQYQAAAPALPALVGCVERGEVSYSVLGAIGRIGGRHPRLVPALIHWLASTNPPAGGTLQTDMAVLLLGLEGESARPAVPELLRRYRALPVVGAETERRLLRRVLGRISPGDARSLPPPQPGEDDDNWP